MDNDQTSTFSYDGEGVPHKFNVSQLKLVVDRYFMEDCRLVKLAEGGYHKVYNVIRGDGVPLDAVVRVACPAFPRDKLESEVATYRFLNAFTKLPIPRIHAWNSDASNPVGAEYMIMDRIPGIPASMKWDSLSEEDKQNVVSQIAHHLLALFSLRFERAGSLCFDLTAAKFYVGPIVSTPFYRALDGFVRTPDIPVSHDIDPNRGPFSTVSEYLSSFLKAELEFVSLHRSLALLEVQDSNTLSPESRLEQGWRVIEKAIELCLVYPGDIPVLGKYSHPEMPFGLKLDDFRLSNVMIDENLMIQSPVMKEGPLKQEAPCALSF
ncbi:hypothetical protein K439DRAFT_298741 [Ramaria rubella]|nr:hypothetical protein K439DRAFT_298741 [Ramaria rubella]